MSAQSLTIVALDNPLPANYGGALELANKLRALKAIGCKVELHAYARLDRQSIHPELQEICATVQVYPRVERFWSLVSAVPYTVGTRFSRSLLAQLVAGQGPILFDGLHTTALVPALAGQAPHRPLFLRLHNVESVYYEELAATSVNPVAVAYYKTQATKLQYWEANCYPYFRAVFPIARHEAAAVASVCPTSVRVEWLPAFVDDGSSRALRSAPDGYRVLYHGDFSVQGNQQAVRMLLEAWNRSVPRQAPYWLVLAGRSAERLGEWSLPRHTQVYANPTDMTQVARSCQAVLLPGTQRSGAKFKFLNTVAWGIPHLASPAMALGTGLENCTPVLDLSGNLYDQLTKLFSGAYTETFAEQRRLFKTLYNPVVVAQQLAQACHV